MELLHPTAPYTHMHGQLSGSLLSVPQVGANVDILLVPVLEVLRRGGGLDTVASSVDETKGQVHLYCLGSWGWGVGGGVATLTSG